MRPREMRQILAMMEEDFREEMLEAGQRAGMRIVEVAKQTTAFRNVTRNLRDGIGVPGNIPAASYNLGLRARPEDQAVLRGKSVVVVTRSAMQYSDEVERRTYFMDEAVLAADGILEDEFGQGGARHEVKLARFARR